MITAARRRMAVDVSQALVPPAQWVSRAAWWIHSKSVLGLSSLTERHLRPEEDQLELPAVQHRRSKVRSGRGYCSRTANCGTVESRQAAVDERGSSWK